MKPFAILPARPAKPNETMTVRGLCPLKLPWIWYINSLRNVAFAALIWYICFHTGEDWRDAGKEWMNRKKQAAILLAVLAAACYGVSAPLSKLLLEEIPPAFMAALLYLGAGAGMATVILFKGLRRRESREARMGKKEIPWILWMILLDIAAPILLMYGLTLTNAANASLLNNFEIVATSLIAMALFKESIGKRMWIAIALITLASAILSFEGLDGFSFSAGSLLVVAATVCWGLENNCTRKLSLKDPLQIVAVKGLGSGIGALAIAIALQEVRFNALYIALALLLGFFAYGLSIYFYIRAQRDLGAARTSAYYAVAPFIGVGLSFAVFRQPVTASFMMALAVMLLGTALAAAERHTHLHAHEALTHDHRHTHNDGHHDHPHDSPVGEHSHPHTHDAMSHAHPHTPDTHHRHSH